MMLRLLQWIFLGHVHHWRVHQFGTVVDGKKRVGRWYDEECTSCGYRRYRQDA